MYIVTLNSIGVSLIVSGLMRVYCNPMCLLFTHVHVDSMAIYCLGMVESEVTLLIIGASRSEPHTSALIDFRFACFVRTVRSSD